MFAFWNSLTEPQAILIASLMTVLAAVLGVYAGSIIYGNKVRDLGAALDASKSALSSHEISVLEKLSSIAVKVSDLEAQFTSSSEAIGQMRGSLADVESLVAEPPAGNSANLRENLKSDWLAIRDHVEELVADPSIHGQTRAKYARIDRRSYDALIDSYHIDFGLPNISRIRQALALWNKYRNGKISPSADEVKQMASIRNTVVSN